MAALALLLLADRGTDIGSLRPVELVRMRERSGIVILETDTGDLGWGLTVEQAIAKLKETTSARIYLDTADILLLEAETEAYLPELEKHLKRKTRVAYVEGNVNLEDAAAYLRIHKPSKVIGSHEKPKEKLAFENGKLILKNI